MYYNKEDAKLPVVMAKGEGLIAQRMIEAAEEAGVPVLQNVPLARALYDDVGLQQYLPSELIEPVAEVLRWVQQWKEEGGRY